MPTATIVHNQWMKRPPDERFTSLTALGAMTSYRYKKAKEAVLPNRHITVLPSATDRNSIIAQYKGKTGEYPAALTHWSFGQLSTLAGAPAAYLRSGLPGALVADNLNWGLHHARQVEQVGILLRRPESEVTLAAATGPKYGRVWDAEVADELINEFGDGVTGAWRVPGEFGKQVPITPENTTLYGSDRDIWIFLANETNRVNVPNRRDGKPGSWSRGFYATNSEVGAGVLGFGVFMFDYLCCNRIIWGLQDKHEIRIRHTAGAPLRWDEEVRPVLRELARTDISAVPIEETIKAAQNKKLDTDIEEWLSSRFNNRTYAGPMIAVHLAEENRPIETLFDAVTAATAYARRIEHQDTRVAIERTAGSWLNPLVNPKNRQNTIQSIQL